VRELENGLATAGEHEVTWTGLDDRAQELPSGVYFLRLNACEEYFERKVVLLR